MSKLSRKAKSVSMRIEGFSKSKKRWWLRAVEYSKEHDTKFSDAQKKWAYDNGFLPGIAERYGIDESNVKDFISLKDLLFIYPINDIFRKWINDRVTTRKVLKPFKDNLLSQYFHLYLRDGDALVVKLPDCPEQYGSSIDDVIELVRNEGKIALRSTIGLFVRKIEYSDGRFFFDGTELSENELKEKLSKLAMERVYVITEYVETAEDFGGQDETEASILRLIAYNKYADNPRVGQAYLRVLPADGREDVTVPDNSEEDRVYAKNFMEDEVVLPKEGAEAKASHFCYYPVDAETGAINAGKRLDDENHIVDGLELLRSDGSIIENIPGWERIKQTIVDMCRFIPQIEIMELDIFITRDGFKIVDFSDHPYYPQVVGFNEEMKEYFNMKFRLKSEKRAAPDVKARTVKYKSKSMRWEKLTELFAPPGMRPQSFKRWAETMMEDLHSKNGIPLKDKLWAYRHGFLSYRIPQYGITRENYKNFISDYDYRYVIFLNNRYKIWLEDKITIKYICSKYSQFFPKYYYHVSVRNGEKRIIPLMDLPDYCSNSLESVFELVEREGALACKPQKGAKGHGFYKFSYHDGKYFLNHEEASKEDILAILGNPASQYLITEYIKQHPVINNIYPGAVNTLRIITFSRDGHTHEIGNAYMRVGSKKTGAVDNMGAGGMFVQVDMETGHFSNGKIITENSIVPCPNHPDTGTLLEGEIPHWETIKQGILDICSEIPQLEFLGFDVAITEDGMRLPEINRNPGYPMIETFRRPTIDYLLYKKEAKMRANNIKKTKW